MTRRRVRRRRAPGGYPPVEDPCWDEWSQAIAVFIQQQPRTWAELFEWGTNRAMHEDEVRQLVNYLEIKGKVGFYLGEPVYVTPVLEEGKNP